MGGCFGENVSTFDQNFQDYRKKPSMPNLPMSSLFCLIFPLKTMNVMLLIFNSIRLMGTRSLHYKFEGQIFILTVFTRKRM